MTLSLQYRVMFLILTCCSVFFLSTHPLKESQYSPASDEGYYLKYASLVKGKGLSAFSGLAAWYSSSDEARKHPAPVRVGYILLSAALFQIFGTSFGVLGFISLISFILFLWVCFHYIRKYFDLDTALAAVLLLSSSPLLLGLSRRALVDSSLNLWWTLTVWLFLDVLLRPNRSSYILFISSLVLAVLFKETSIILMPFFVLAGIWARKLNAFQIAGILFWPGVAVSMITMGVLGGPQELCTLATAISQTHLTLAHNPYAVNYSSGPWFRYMVDFLLLTPIVTLLFIGYAGYLILQKTQPGMIKQYLLFYFIFVFTALSALPHSKVVRFVLGLELVMNLFAVFMLKERLERVSKTRGARCFFFACVGIFLFNWCGFSGLFYGPGLLDPISYHLLTLRHFIPG